MSNALVRKGLETRLNAMAPALATAWQNVSFKPPPGTPYQEVHLLWGAPENPAFGSYYREVGVFQVSLMYPQGTGPAAADARAAAVRDWFKRGTTIHVFPDGASMVLDFVNQVYQLDPGLDVIIERTPAIADGYQDGDRWRVPISIPFFASVSG
ncbi:phage tail terminator-like protein [Cupriavidus sp. 2TAF22]|uniref:phage tail terminator-like protein n=1 Tax=unclassified Cupriavidus TaxID=2640874 RepID=UPI003F8E76A0